MMNDINSGLIITVIGMGLVFIAIIFLWGLMVFMVRVDEKISQVNKAPEGPTSEDESKPAISQKQQAAAAALAVALMQKEMMKSSFSNETVGQIGAWQSVQRAQVLQDKSRVFAHRQTRRS